MKIRLYALADLLKRYGAVFQAVWRRRAEMAAVRRLPYEAQFLPAALSLQETPVSPAPRIAMWLLVAFSALTMFWALFGQIDVVATARGKVIPNDRTKTIQAFETASVKALHVTDGQVVKRGEVLIELDATTAEADRQRIMNDLIAARLQVARGKAMLDALESGKIPSLQKSFEVDDLKFNESQSLLLGQYGEYKAKLRRIEAEIAKRAAELQSTLQLVRKLEQTVPIAHLRAQDFKNLVDRHFVSRHDYLEREQQRIEQEGDLASQKSRLKEIEAALLEAHEQTVELTAETRRVHLDSVNESLQKIATLEQELLKADLHSKLMQITSPIEGTVQQLAVHTVGGVVTPAQALMMVVPGSHPLEIEAFIENKDIGFVKPGQDADVKVETFQYTQYGTIHAQVASVSHDAINDEKRGLIYSTRVKMEKARINMGNIEFNLSPGMAVSVEIKTDKRRVIEFFLSPLLHYAHESLRER